MPTFMNQAAAVMLCILLSAPALFAAAKEPPKPDREMLRMMEFLKEMELLQQMEMMREMHEVDNAGELSRDAGGWKTAPTKNKGTPK
ncbi:MAG: hypothetical protein OEN50_05885 [Deltaproteobacteria bacterium]|nr:hypothetical protein [Deltaproteobacteria bacterium]